MKKVSKVGFMRANPNATYQEFKAATGGTKNSFYTNRWVAAHYDPSGTWKKKNKSKEEKPSADKMRIAELEAETRELRDQIIAYKAVISYLEHGVSHMEHGAKNYSGFDNFRGFE